MLDGLRQQQVILLMDIWGGGYSTSLVSTVDRVDYSNDTATAAPKGPLSSTRSSTAATGNADYGYHGVVVKILLYQQ